MKNLNKLILIIILIGCNIGTYSQVGINAADLDTSAILHIVHNSKGVLFPNIDDVDQVNEVNGMFIFKTTDNKFYYYQSSTSSWQCINPFSSTSKDTIEGNIKIQNGGLTIQGGNLTVQPENTINGYGTMPIGGIIMWSGSPAPLPAGWALCDGMGTYVDHAGTTRNIPDLRGRFIVGYGVNGTGLTNDLYGNLIWDPTYATIGAKNSGELKHKLTSGESGIVAHNHLVTGNTNLDGVHKHWARGTAQRASDNDGGHYARADWENMSEDLGSGAGPVTRTDGEHQHQISITSQNVASASALSSHENRPPYYVLAFIIRVK